MLRGGNNMRSGIKNYFAPIKPLKRNGLLNIREYVKNTIKEKE